MTLFVHTAVPGSYAGAVRPLLEQLAADPVIAELSRHLLRGGHHQARGSTGSSTPLIAAAIARSSNRPVFLLCAHVDEAEEAVDAIESAGMAAIPLPALQTLPGDSTVSVELLSGRLAAVQAVMSWGDTPPAVVLVAPIHALMQPVPAAAELERVMLELETGDARGPAAVVRWLDEAGYTRNETVEEPGEFAVRGGIVDIFPPGDSGKRGGADASLGGVPVRLDFFGQELEKIAEIDLDSMGIDRVVKRVRLVGMPRAVEAPQDDLSVLPTGKPGRKKAGLGPGARTGEGDGVQFLDLLPKSTIGILHELLEITEQGRGYYERITGSGQVFGPPSVLSSLNRRCVATLEITQIAQYATDKTIQLPVSPLFGIEDEIPEAIGQLVAAAKGQHGDEPHRVLVLCQNAAEGARLTELIETHAPPGTREAGLIEMQVQYMHQGFIFSPSTGFPGQPEGGGAGKAGRESQPLLVIPYHELLHRFQARRSVNTTAKRMKTGRAIDTFLDVEVGDYVVHSEHGIARFTGLQVIRRGSGAKSADEVMADVKAATGHKKPGAGRGDSVDPYADTEEMLLLEFDGRSLLHVPASRIDLVQKYIGGSKGAPQLSTLGGTRWKNQKARVSESLKDLAGELLRIRAAREHLPGIKYPADTVWQKQFEDEFPYEETEDQLAAIAEIKRDMTSPRPMDRLLCGDVGYGKTELAIRAAFKAAEAGKQVAILVPTTVLAEQHERTFSSRMADFPFRIESVSRFKSAGEVSATLERLAAGQVDILIGTHRLLSADVRFKDLGLVVIDEEQRFGVEHKEKLLALRLTVDVLTMTATPIPRTLHMSMLGLRDISSLTTAPMDRRAVVTEVAPHNKKRLAQIIRRELARDGQVFYVHNRVHNIKSVADDVKQLVPEARVVFGHGQMTPGELEDVFLAFTRRQADIFVSTTIIESGIDIPTANTMIIADADRFGLAELHQLRGRVGRYKHRAYCYLLLPDDRPIKEKAKKRLAAIEQFSMLGAGFKIAMRDLEIRGAGNILGPEQSGHIATVGYDMYCQLLERGIKELRHESVSVPSEVTLELGFTGIIPKPYVPSDQRRLEAYRRLATAGSVQELTKVREDLQSAYGLLPPAVERLLELADLRAGLRSFGVRSVLVKGSDVIIRTVTPAPVMVTLADAPGRAVCPPPRNVGEMAEVYFRPHNPVALEPATLVSILRKRFGVGRAGGLQNASADGAAAPASADVSSRSATPGRGPSGPSSPSNPSGIRGAPAAAAAPIVPRITKPVMAPPAAVRFPVGPKGPGRLSKGLADIKRQLREADIQVRTERKAREDAEG